MAILQGTSDSKSPQNSSNIMEHISSSSISSLANQNDLTTGNLTVKLPFEHKLNNKVKCLAPCFNKPNQQCFNNENNSIDDNKDSPGQFLSSLKDFPSIQTKRNASRNSMNEENHGYQVPRTSQVSNTYFEKWRSRPNKCSEYKDIVPLEQPEPISIQPNELLHYMNEKINSATFEILCQEMSKKLDSFCEHFIFSEQSNDKTQWVPIKVCTFNQVLLTTLNNGKWALIS
jgi:hypothetical protein